MSTLCTSDLFMLDLESIPLNTKISSTHSEQILKATLENVSMLYFFNATMYCIFNKS